MKLKITKERVKTWRERHKEQKSREIGELKTKLLVLNTLEETVRLPEDDRTERGDLIRQIKFLESLKLEDLKKKSRIKWTSEGDEISKVFMALSMVGKDQIASGAFLLTGLRKGSEQVSTWFLVSLNQNTKKPSNKGVLFEMIHCLKREH